MEKMDNIHRTDRYDVMTVSLDSTMVASSSSVNLKVVKKVSTMSRLNLHCRLDSEELLGNENQSRDTMNILYFNNII